MERLTKLYYYLLLIFVIIFSLYIRFDDVKIWKAREHQFFYKGEPLYSEYDSFYFARNALDIKEGLFRHGEIDHFRFFPDNSSQAKLSEKEPFYPEYSLPGNFISYLFYLLHKITGISVAWLTYYLIPILATTVVFPLFFYFKHLKLPLAGIIGGLVAVSAPMYLGRTSLMRLDHDVFNLTFPFLIAFFFYRFFETKSLRAKYFWISLSSLFLLLYYLWYAHSNLNFVLILSFPFVYIWGYFKTFFKKSSTPFLFTKHDAIFLTILILPQIWYIYSGPYYLYKQVITLVFNIKSPTSVDILFKDFPNIFMSISELSKLNFDEAISAVIFNKILGIAGLIGAFLLFIFHFRQLIFLLPFFIIGLLVFVSGARFAMYLSPFLGLGLGYLVHFLFEKVLPYLEIFREEGKQRIVVFLVGLSVFFTVFIAQRESIGMVSTPKVDSELVKDMEWLKENTPKNAVIWSWWDYGYAFQLYARRAVFHDGGTQTSPKTYFIARSFTTSDPKEAWYITSFLSNYGLTGLAKIMKEGLSAEDVVEKVKSGDFN
ncbi:MAG: STT3 domain-containing protein, partial [Caldimicrobium sp.]